ncbi:hypothetical protein [Lysobacter gummosus]|uniref:hypothetical protein n=1 Tax=Lysobacter gummosus TaxID=262324 RepID=UPI00362E088C
MERRRCEPIHGRLGKTRLARSIRVAHRHDGPHLSSRGRARVRRLDCGDRLAGNPTCFVPCCSPRPWPARALLPSPPRLRRPPPPRPPATPRRKPCSACSTRNGNAACAKVPKAPATTATSATTTAGPTRA